MNTNDDRTLVLVLTALSMFFGVLWIVAFITLGAS